MLMKSLKWAVGAAAMAGLAGLSLAQDAAVEFSIPDPVIEPGNTGFMMIATVLVLMMTIPGLALFYGDGATMAEIAQILETTPKAVEGLLGRARMELKALLAEPAAPELRS